MKYSNQSYKQVLIYSVQSLLSQQHPSSKVISVYWLIVEYIWISSEKNELFRSYFTLINAALIFKSELRGVCEICAQIRIWRTNTKVWFYIFLFWSCVIGENTLSLDHCLRSVFLTLEYAHLQLKHHRLYQIYGTKTEPPLTLWPC